MFSDYTEYLRPSPCYWWAPPAPIAPTPWPKRVLIPKLPPPTYETEYECGECGMIFKGAMGYVCNNPCCPVFPVITCNTITLKQTPIPGGWL